MNRKTAVSKRSFESAATMVVCEATKLKYIAARTSNVTSVCFLSLQSNVSATLPLPRIVKAFDGPSLLDCFSAFKCGYDARVLFKPSSSDTMGV
uniref:Uncharacterized protein MANES_16G087200 n=1 Tax=Rhizophora mucronata TaxID=61149 RepID=A0A2P2KXS9_RHIMU